MAIFLGLLCAIASLLLTAVVALMNYRFMTRLGGSELDGQVLGTASVTIDVMLAVIGPLVVWGLLQRRRLYAWSLIGMAAIFALLSFVSALGFAAEGRDTMAAGRETERMAVDGAQQKLARLVAARNELGYARSLVVVEAAIEAQRGDRRWVMSRQCAAVRQKEMADWCTALHRLNEERARAGEADRLDAEIAAANSELLSLRAKSGSTILDSQVDLIAQLTGWPPDKVRAGIVLLVASAMQLGAGFGLAIGLAPVLVVLEERRRQRVSKPQFGEHLSWKQSTRPSTGAEDANHGRGRRNTEDTVGDQERPREHGKGSRRRLN
jgi:hypothetical protein